MWTWIAKTNMHSPYYISLSSKMLKLPGPFWTETLSLQEKSTDSVRHGMDGYPEFKMTSGWDL